MALHDFAGRIAVVTGATGGVGSAIAGELLALGAFLVLPSRSVAAVDRLAAERGWNRERIDARRADLSDAGDTDALARHLTAAYAEIDVLVHAAGALALGSLEESDAATLDHQYQVNLRAPYQLTRALLPALRREAGQIVFVNSSAGLHANADGSQYGATKHALRALADSLRQEVNASGVRVLSVYLGRTASRMQASVHEHEGRPYRPELLLQPGDVAAMVTQALRLPRTAEVTDLHIRPMRKP